MHNTRIIYFVFDPIPCNGVLYGLRDHFTTKTKLNRMPHWHQMQPFSYMDLNLFSLTRRYNWKRLRNIWEHDDGFKFRSYIVKKNHLVTMSMMNVNTTKKKIS